MRLLRSARFWWVASFGALAGMVIASFILPGGDDLYRYYQPFAQGCLDCGYVPYFSRWFLWPLWLPHPFAWPVWTLISGVGFLLIARSTKVNPFLLLVTFPMLAQIWGGQIDILIAAGFLLMVKGHNPLLKGLGMVMALIKPQLSFIPLFYFLLGEKRSDLLKLFLIPLLVGVLSLLVFGLDWPLEWIRNANGLPLHPRRQASLDIWKFGIFLSWVPFLFKQADRRWLASLVIASIATPFFSNYSYVIFLAFFLPAWAVPISYSWLLLSPMQGVQANRYAWMLPLSLLFALAFYELRDRLKQRPGVPGATHA